MKRRRPRSDDVLFISALAAVLLGIELLLYTTRTLWGVAGAWPIVVMAAGGALLYFALVRGSSIYILFGGTLFVLEGAFFQVASLAAWPFSRSWPLVMATAGAAGLVTGLIARQGLKARHLVPSIGFLGLGVFFALFSFKWIKAGFSDFIAAWWPTAFIVGGVCLFVAYGISRRKSRQSRGGVGGSSPSGSSTAGESGGGASGRSPGP